MLCTLPTPYPIHLEWYECAVAEYVGYRRQEQALARHLKNTHGFQGDPVEIHCEGAAGEMAVAKALNIYWAGTINTFDQADIGWHMQVRSRSQHFHDLIVRSGDADTDVFLLVTGHRPEYVLRGWAWGSEAKDPSFLRSYGGRSPAYFFPQTALHTLSTLPSIL